FHKEFMMRRRDGTIFPTDHTVTEIRDDEGSRVGVVSAVRDITGRKRIEDALRESEERYRSLFENSHAVLLVINPDDGSIVDANPAAVAYYGWTREELKNKKISEINTLTPDQVKAEMELAREEKRAHFVFKHRRTQGEPRDVEVYSGPIKIKGRALLYSIIFDITDRKRMEEALRQSETELQEAQRIAHVGSWRLDNATNHVVWTEELYRMLGLDPSRPPPDYTEHMRLFTPESWERLSSALALTQEQGVPYKLELEMVRPGKSNGWMLAIGEPMRDASGAIIGLQGVAQDITDRKSAEEAIQRNERRLAEAQRIAKMGNWEWDIVSGANLWSDEQFRIFGFEPGSFSPDYEFFMNALLPEDRPKVRAALDDVLAGRAPYSIDCQITTPDGTVKHIHCEGEIKHDPSGKSVRMAGTVQDITDRKRAEQAIRESEEKFRAIFEGATDYIMVLEPTRDGSPPIIIDASEPAFAKHGYSRQELIGKPITFLDLEDAKIPMRMGELFRKGTAQFEVVHRRKDGSQFLAEVFSKSIDVGGKTIFYTIERDITDRKKAETALRQSEERYRTLVNNIEAAVVVHSTDTSITAINQKALDLLGITAEQAYGRMSMDPEWRFLTPEGKPLSLEMYPVNQVLSSAASLNEMVVGINRPVRRDVVWVVVSAVPVFDEKGNIKEVFVSFMDITERKRAEEQLRLISIYTRNLIETSLDPLVTINADGKITDVNSATEKVTGLPRD
ncbi:MAG: PAS domain S-box protein, partial [Nitrospinae bacterium]|nr:PAS domain S-box protein [Nitrospinota bacterium]